MSLLDRIFRSKLTQEEEAYKAKTWQQIETLAAPALKAKPDELAKVKAKVLKEIDEQIYYARSVGKTPQQMEDERVAGDEPPDREQASVSAAWVRSFARGLLDVHPAEPQPIQLLPRSWRASLERSTDRGLIVPNYRQELPYLQGSTGSADGLVRH